MPAPPPNPHRTPPEPTFDMHTMYCRGCKRALNTFRDAATGTVTYLHAVELRGGSTDHRPDPAPLTQIDAPLMECDFCSAPEAAWAYICADQVTSRRVVTSRAVDAGEYRDRHHAARTRSVRTTDTPAQSWGSRWTACSKCSELIEARDLYGLISRVTDAMPAKYTRGRRLVSVRAHLHATYSAVFDTLAPGRGRITAETPLGAWSSESPPGL